MHVKVMDYDAQHFYDDEHPKESGDKLDNGLCYLPLPVISENVPR
jgi:hypothetical protein